MKKVIVLIALLFTVGNLAMAQSTKGKTKVEQTKVIAMVSTASCKQAGILKVADNCQTTGVIYFINDKTKEVISQVSIVKTNEEIISAFNEALAKI